ncbi:MAG: OsmC family protein [Pseudohongiellaceae bacterium]
MSRYTAQIQWQCDSDSFLENRYSRAHSWTFDGGLTVPASSSPSIVPEPWSVSANVDPEEAFVATLSSCHMLWFLSLARDRGLKVLAYSDNALGTMGKNSSGKLAITTVTLQPKVSFCESSEASKTVIAEIHHDAHEKCFIANSVTSIIQINPVYSDCVD